LGIDKRAGLCLIPIAYNAIAVTCVSRDFKMTSKSNRNALQAASPDSLEAHVTPLKRCDAAMSKPTYAVSKAENAIKRFRNFFLEEGTDVLPVIVVFPARLTESPSFKGFRTIKLEAEEGKDLLKSRVGVDRNYDIIAVDANHFWHVCNDTRRTSQCPKEQSLKFERETIPHRGELLINEWYPIEITDF
jgi:hypothetical protein